VVDAQPRLRLKPFMRNPTRCRILRLLEQAEAVAQSKIDQAPECVALRGSPGRYPPRLWDRARRDPRGDVVVAQHGNAGCAPPIPLHQVANAVSQLSLYWYLSESTLWPFGT